MHLDTEAQHPMHVPYPSRARLRTCAAPLRCKGRDNYFSTRPTPRYEMWALCSVLGMSCRADFPFVPNQPATHAGSICRRGYEENCPLRMSSPQWKMAARSMAAIRAEKVSRVASGYTEQQQRTSLNTLAYMCTRMLHKKVEGGWHRRSYFNDW